MSKVNYVECPSCHKEYYIDRILSAAVETNPRQHLKCPHCKQLFNLGGENTKSGDDSKSEAAGAAPMTRR